MRLRTGLQLAVLVPLLSGCATLRATIDGWDGGRDGMTGRQRELREALSGGDFPAALAWREDDALLRVLTSGATTYYAAQYARSAALLDTAALLADERLTASVSRNALSLVTNDMARAYQPRRTERLFVPYYGMLSYARLGQWEDAAVEARRMVALLAQFKDDREDGERGMHASMHYLAGAVFERAGERDASAVAYRNAHALSDAYPERPAARRANEGDVLVLVERGFVAHRTTESIHLVLGDGERDELRGSDESRRRAVDRLRDRLAPPPPVVDALSAVPAFGQRQVVAAPAVSSTPEEPMHERHLAPRRPEHGDDSDDEDDDERHLTLAVPALRRSARPWAGFPRVLADSAGAVVGAFDVRVSSSVDDASEVDQRRERAGMISRELARAATKYAVTKAVRDKKGDVAGRLAEMGASLLDRADVRSWHVLPQELVLLRLRMPAGQHSLIVGVGEGASYRQVDLGTVTVRPGAVTVLPARFWREPSAEYRTRCTAGREMCRF